MLLETELTHVPVLLLGAGEASRTARRLRAAGAELLAALETPEDALPQDRDAAGAVVVVGERAPWREHLARLRGRPVIDAPAEQSGITLIGGGPGADDLVTARGLAALADADVVLLDRLAPQDVVRAQAPHARVVPVGKTPGLHPVPQEEIQRILLSAAGEGQHVVRLKGGDPFVFGRGGEEAADAEAWDIPVRTVPGITSAISMPGAAGIPVTFREVSRALTVASGHAPFDDDELRSFTGLLATGATLVVLMGTRTLPQLVAGLSRHGAAADLPVAVIEKGFSPAQRVLTATLGTALHELSGASSPAVIVVGQVAALAGEDRERVLGELTPHRAVAPSAGQASERQAEPAGPLTGRRIAVTAHRRAEDQIAALRRKGAEVMAAPALRLLPVEDDREVLDQTRALIADPPQLLVVTTGYGLKRWWQVAEAGGLAEALHRALSGAEIWARGPKGRGVLRTLELPEAGVSADETLPTLIDQILQTHPDLTGAAVGWQENGFADRAQRARLTERGARILPVVPHRWAEPPDDDATAGVPELIRAAVDGRLDAITFTSAAGADAVLSAAAELGLAQEFADAFRPRTGSGGSGRAVLAATVGPVTAQPLEDAGIPALVPERFRMGAMIQQLTRVLSGRPRD